MLRLVTVIASAALIALVSGCDRPHRSPSDQPLDSPRTITPAAQPSATAPKPPPSSPLVIEPDNGLNPLYALVTGAHATIDMTMYELVDTTLSNDLVAACKRGVKVRVILDQSLEKASNTAAYNQLKAAGPNCSVAWSNPQFQATHQKTLILDGKTAVIMTLNFTSRYYSTSRDLALLDTNSADISAIQSTFNTDFNSSTDLGYQPPAGANLIWSPTSAQPALLGIINGAKKTLLVENEEMGAASIVSALEAACKRGVAVQIAMTDTNILYHANFQALQAAGCGVHIGPNNSTALYIHAKTMVADLGQPSQLGYLGSINFSTASMTRNRELGLYLHDPAVLAQVAATITKDYNGFPPYQASTLLQKLPPARP